MKNYPEPPNEQKNFRTKKLLAHKTPTYLCVFSIALFLNGSEVALLRPQIHSSLQAVTPDNDGMNHLLSWICGTLSSILVSDFLLTGCV